MNTNAVELQDTISRELGIDVTKYRDENVAENLVDLLLFPKYIIKWVIQPILLALLLYILGFFVVDLVHVQFVIYTLLGFVLFAITGVLAGVMNLSRKLNADLSSISTYSLGVMKSAVVDIDNVGDRINSENKKDVMNMLFQGIIHIVTIPMVSKALDKKLPVGAGIVTGLMRRSLMAVSDRLDFDDDKIDERLIIADEDAKVVSAYVAAIDGASARVTGLLGLVTKVISTPFRIGFYLCLSVLVLFLYLIW